MKVLAIVLPILLLIGMGIWLGITIYNKDNYENPKTGVIQITISSILAVASILILFFIPNSIHQVEAGQIAVVKRYGQITETRTEGLTFDNWIENKYIYYDLKTQEIQSDISAYSKDAQSMDASLTVQFRVQSDKVIDITKEFGELPVLTERIRAIAEEKAKVVLASSPAMTLIEQRNTLSSNVETAIEDAVSQYYVDVTMVAVTDITFSEAFENTVEQKMIAEQEKLKAEYEKEKAIIQAEQALEVAKLEAEAKLAQAQGEADAIEVVAIAQANSIKSKSIEVARMLGFNITETVTEDGVIYDIDFTGKTDAEIKTISEYLRYVEYLEAWSGELPDVVAGDSTSILIPKV